ncbi:MAG: beta-1,6-N-acetylglucosaminyltransferase [Bacteroides sp.]|nr:beta-1,6-N-acetylglucosaminyltransferase [Bacteroides sp.]
MNKKHAFLIVAHKNDLTFRTLIKMLDYEYNDIFIHMDKKNRNYNPVDTKRLCSKSEVYHIDRVNVMWGGYSLACATLELLKKSVSTEDYKYYHLLSGEDLPIKTQSHIHNFFNNESKEFVLFDDRIFRHADRVQYYYPFQDFMGKKCLKIWNRVLRKISVFFQRLIGINRSKGIVFQKGCNWFSITNEFANYVVSKEEWIRKHFKYTFIPDEIFIQTLLMHFKDKADECSFDDDYTAIKRLIDWKRGKPYIFRMSDIDEINNSESMFARKFSSEVDSEIIDYVLKRYG